jgi:hypothetical protein
MFSSEDEENSRNNIDVFKHLKQQSHSLTSNFKDKICVGLKRTPTNTVAQESSSSSPFSLPILFKGSLKN